MLSAENHMKAEIPPAIAAHSRRIAGVLESVSGEM